MVVGSDVGSTSASTRVGEGRLESVASMLVDSFVVSHGSTVFSVNATWLLQCFGVFEFIAFETFGCTRAVLSCEPLDSGGAVALSSRAHVIVGTGAKVVIPLKSILHRYCILCWMSLLRA